MNIVLDPGHGGTVANGRSTPIGVRGLEGTLEKDVTWQLAELVARRLGADARLTRTADQNPSLGQRALVSSSLPAAVFLSLHANGDRPGARGAEAWVHDDANAASLRLAARLQRAVGVIMGAGAGVRRGRLAVLTPSRHDPGTAACSLEVGFLDDPEVEARLRDPAVLTRIADAVAEAVRAHLTAPAGESTYGRARQRPLARAADEGGYFTDADELGAYLRDLRAADTRMYSSRADAQAVVASFRAGAGAGAWPSLDRAEVADRMQALVDQPRLIQQGALNLCGPAAMVCMWCARDPVGFARYACRLFETGTGRVGSLQVTPRANLRTRDYAEMLTRMGAAVSPQADWMVLGALRNADDVFWQWTGDPEQTLAGATTPGELADWLRATGVYREVRNEANWVRLKGIPHALGLQPLEGTDIALLINANMLAAATGGKKDSNWILNQFPNHFIVLMSEVTRDVRTDELFFTAWTWGDTTEYRVPMQAFLDNYYGAVIARM